MQIWAMDPYDLGDRRLPHHVFPPKRLSPDQLATIAGVQTYKVDLEDTMSLKKRISRVKTERNVNASDMLMLSDKLNDFAGKLEEFYEARRKDCDWVVLVLDGVCYFDVEPSQDEWIRLQCDRGDLIVIPSGLPHRFTVTPQNYVQLQRFFHKRGESSQG